VSTADGRRSRVSVVARAAADGHWNAWLEFVAEGSQDVLRTDIETHQATEADLHRWALGEHVLRRELQLFRRATRLALIINYDLNARSLDVSRFTEAQLVAFIVTAVEVRQTRIGSPRHQGLRNSRAS
jgi:hypothetical protein